MLFDVLQQALDKKKMREERSKTSKLKKQTRPNKQLSRESDKPFGDGIRKETREISLADQGCRQSIKNLASTIFSQVNQLVE